MVVEKVVEKKLAWLNTCEIVAFFNFFFIKWNCNFFVNIKFFFLPYTSDYPWCVNNTSNCMYFCMANSYISHINALFHIKNIWLYSFSIIPAWSIQLLYSTLLLKYKSCFVFFFAPWEVNDDQLSLLKFITSK